MEDVRLITRAYYDRATNEEKELVKQYFNNFKGNGKITLQQFKKGVPEHLSGDNIFRKLDSNRDGTLDLEETKCLYYMVEKLGIQKCAVCPDLLVGAYFSCFRCVEDGLDSVCSLCCYCYHSGKKITHIHESRDFVDQHTMVKKLKNHVSGAQRRDRKKKELEELRQIAKSYYHKASKKVQKLAHDFFNTLDENKDGSVSFKEFMEFMKEVGYTDMQDPEFFKELDIDGNGTLDFYEIMTVYYIIKTGRPFCNKCGSFIQGIFFSCVECYRNPKGSSFNLCCNCYGSEEYDHKHDGGAQFLDNFALLEAMKDASGRTTNESDQQNQANPSVAAASSEAAKSQTTSKYTHTKSEVPLHTTTVPTTPNITQIVTYNPTCIRPKGAKWRFALEALEALDMALNITTTVLTCAIM